MQKMASINFPEVETEPSDPEEDRECEEEGEGSGGEDKVEEGKEEERDEEGEAEEASSCDLTPQDFSKRRIWEREQENLKLKLRVEDGDEVRSWEEDTLPFAHLSIVAGVDISFEKEHPNHACAMLSVLSYPQLKVLHVSQAVVEMTEPYLPGFLAFREVDFLLDRLKEIERKHPQFYPQVILVDGNGILHPRGFGLASHLGVLADIPCIGVGKKLYHVDGLQKGPEHKQKIHTMLKKKGDYFHLTGLSGQIWGAAVRTSDEAANPVYVSIGHKMSLDTAVKLAVACSIKRVPEPVRQADLLSRRFLRKQKHKSKLL